MEEVTSAISHPEEHGDSLSLPTLEWLLKAIALQEGSPSHRDVEAAEEQHIESVYIESDEWCVLHSSTDEEEYVMCLEYATDLSDDEEQEEVISTTEETEDPSPTAETMSTDQMSNTVLTSQERDKVCSAAPTNEVTNEAGSLGQVHNAFPHMGDSVLTGHVYNAVPSRQHRCSHGSSLLLSMCCILSLVAIVAMVAMVAIVAIVLTNSAANPSSVNAPGPSDPPDQSDPPGPTAIPPTMCPALLADTHSLSPGICKQPVEHSLPDALVAHIAQVSPDTPAPQPEMSHDTSIAVVYRFDFDVCKVTVPWNQNDIASILPEVHFSPPLPPLDTAAQHPPTHIAITALALLVPTYESVSKSPAAAARARINWGDHPVCPVPPPSEENHTSTMTCNASLHTNDQTKELNTGGIVLDSLALNSSAVKELLTMHLLTLSYSVMECWCLLKCFLAFNYQLQPRPVRRKQSRWGKHGKKHSRWKREGSHQLTCTTESFASACFRAGQNFFYTLQRAYSVASSAISKTLDARPHLTTGGLASSLVSFGWRILHSLKDALADVCSAVERMRSQCTLNVQQYFQKGERVSTSGDPHKKDLSYCHSSSQDSIEDSVTRDSHHSTQASTIRSSQHDIRCVSDPPGSAAPDSHSLTCNHSGSHHSVQEDVSQGNQHDVSGSTNPQVSAAPESHHTSTSNQSVESPAQPVQDHKTPDHRLSAGPLPSEDRSHVETSPGETEASSDLTTGTDTSSSPHTPQTEPATERSPNHTYSVVSSAVMNTIFWCTSFVQHYLTTEGLTSSLARFRQRIRHCLEDACTSVRSAAERMKSQYTLKFNVLRYFQRGGKVSISEGARQEDVASSSYFHSSSQHSMNGSSTRDGTSHSSQYDIPCGSDLQSNRAPEGHHTSTSGQSAESPAQPVQDHKTPDHRLSAGPLPSEDRSHVETSPDEMEATSDLTTGTDPSSSPHTPQTEPACQPTPQKTEQSPNHSSDSSTTLAAPAARDREKPPPYRAATLVMMVFLTCLLSWKKKQQGESCATVRDEIRTEGEGESNPRGHLSSQDQTMDASLEQNRDDCPTSQDEDSSPSSQLDRQCSEERQPPSGNPHSVQDHTDHSGNSVQDHTDHRGNSAPSGVQVDQNENYIPASRSVPISTITRVACRDSQPAQLPASGSDNPADSACSETHQRPPPAQHSSTSATMMSPSTPPSPPQAPTSLPPSPMEPISQSRTPQEKTCRMASEHSELQSDTTDCDSSELEEDTHTEDMLVESVESSVEGESQTHSAAADSEAASSGSEGDTLTEDTLVKTAESLVGGEGRTPSTAGDSEAASSEPEHTHTEDTPVDEEESSVEGEGQTHSAVGDGEAAQPDSSTPAPDSNTTQSRGYVDSSEPPAPYQSARKLPKAWTWIVLHLRAVIIAVLTPLHIVQLWMKGRYLSRTTESDVRVEGGSTETEEERGTREPSPSSHLSVQEGTADGSLTSEQHQTGQDSHGSSRGGTEQSSRHCGQSQDDYLETKQATPPNQVEDNHQSAGNYIDDATHSGQNHGSYSSALNASKEDGPHSEQKLDCLAVCKRSTFLKDAEGDGCQSSQGERDRGIHHHQTEENDYQDQTNPSKVDSLSRGTEKGGQSQCVAGLTCLVNTAMFGPMNPLIHSNTSPIPESTKPELVCGPMETTSAALPDVHTVLQKQPHSSSTTDMNTSPVLQSSNRLEEGASYLAGAGVKEPYLQDTSSSHQFKKKKLPPLPGHHVLPLSDDNGEPESELASAEMEEQLTSVPDPEVTFSPSQDHGKVCSGELVSGKQTLSQSCGLQDMEDGESELSRVDEGGRISERRTQELDEEGEVEVWKEEGMVEGGTEGGVEEDSQLDPNAPSAPMHVTYSDRHQEPLITAGEKHQSLLAHPLPKEQWKTRQRLTSDNTHKNTSPSLGVEQDQLGTELATRAPAQKTHDTYSLTTPTNTHDDSAFTSEAVSKSHQTGLRRQDTEHARERKPKTSTATLDSGVGSKTNTASHFGKEDSLSHFPQHPAPVKHPPDYSTDEPPLPPTTDASAGKEVQLEVAVQECNTTGHPLIGCLSAANSSSPVPLIGHGVPGKRDYISHPRNQEVAASLPVHGHSNNEAVVVEEMATPPSSSDAVLAVEHSISPLDTHSKMSSNVEVQSPVQTSTTSGLLVGSSFYSHDPIPKKFSHGDNVPVLPFDGPAQLFTILVESPVPDELCTYTKHYQPPPLPQPLFGGPLGYNVPQPFLSLAG